MPSRSEKPAVNNENEGVSVGETIILQCIVSAVLLVVVLVVSMFNIEPMQFLRGGLQQALSGAASVDELIEEVRFLGEDLLGWGPGPEPEAETEVPQETITPQTTIQDTLVPVEPLPEYYSQVEPLATQPLWTTPVSGRISSPSGTRYNPVTGRREFHDGIDIAIPVGTPIYAPKTGEVIASGFCAGYGRFMRLSHDNGYLTFYAHLSRANAYIGDIVQQGERIAYSGNTGQSTGPHLHFGIFHNGQFIDPLTRVSP
jgi:murein DD-endopeptidase MepM/ murein hydrolase activator NlpD